jgi:O-antigen/teichoic acid export membrane protein
MIQLKDDDMNKKKLFLENFFVYGIGSMISKIVPFIMLPIITRLMPNTFYYGLNDISNIIVSFGSAIAILGMYDAMFRMFFEKEDMEYKKEVCSSAFYFVTGTAIIVFTLLMIFRPFFSNLFFSSFKYSNLLIITALTILIGASNSIISAPTRMLNKRKVFLITNTLSPILSYCIAVPLLIKGMFVMALPLAALIASFSMLITFYILNRSWFSIKKVNVKLIKEMMKIGLPLAPLFLVYWVFNSCDRLMIAKFIGNAAVGIYGIGARAASISQFVYMAFSGGWSYFAFSTMNTQDQVKMTSNIFEYLGVISFSVTVFLTSISMPIFKLFFVGNYVHGAVVFPYLFLSPLLLMLFQTIGSQFVIKKKTWPLAVILSVGAVINFIAIYFLIPILGIEGAAIGTLLGYIVSVCICSVVLTKYKLVSISYRFLISCVVTCIFFIVWRLFTRENIIISLIFSLIAILVYGYLYKDELKICYKLVKKLLQKN